MFETHVNEKWIRKDDGSMELIEQIEVEREVVIDEKEILWQAVTELQLSLILTNQSLTHAEIELEEMKGGSTNGN